MEGVYTVTVDAAQHKVVVAGSLGADALVRRLNKAGKMAALWPAAEEVTAADKADAKAKDKQGGAEGSSPKKKPWKKVVDAAKQKDAKEEKGSAPEPAKEASTGEEARAGEQEGSAKKKKKPHKDGGGVADEGEKKPHVGGGGLPPYHAPQPVTSYNVTHPSASVSYHCYAPTPPAVPMQPVPPPPEYLYCPPGMRTSPPQESYSNVFDEENANSCSLM
jgi:hypothetical protein